MNTILVIIFMLIFSGQPGMNLSFSPSGNLILTKENDEHSYMVLTPNVNGWDNSPEFWVDCTDGIKREGSHSMGEPSSGVDLKWLSITMQRCWSRETNTQAFLQLSVYSYLHGVITGIILSIVFALGWYIIKKIKMAS